MTGSSGSEAPGSNAGKRLLTPAAVLIIFAILLGGVAGAAVSTLWDHGSKTTVIQQAGTATGSTPPGVQDLYMRVRPSVVKINAVSTSTGNGGTGSGVILDTQGHIATNYHVVNGFDQLDVKLADGSDVPAQVVGTDPGDDLAIVQIDISGTEVTAATLADFSKVQVGDAVIAIGNPFDLEATLTEGVVSGLDRILTSTNARPLRQLIQTDTAINPGNSGGGLFNLNGELIGLTNALENPSGQDVFVGIGYAIPVSTLQQYLPDMMAGKTISHARLGVALEDLTPSIATAMGLNVQQGVLVAQVQAGSGAASAGLRGTSFGQPGDVIVAIDGNKVKAFEDIASYLDTKNPGDTVKLDIVRDGSTTSVSVTLDAWTQ